MTDGAGDGRTTPVDARLREEVAACLARDVPGGPRSLRFLPSADAATHAIVDVTATWGTGARTSYVLKDYARLLWPEGDLRDPTASPRQEILAYRTLLAEVAPGTARLVGAGEEVGREWLLVSRVPGRRLDGLRAPPAWREAGLWLGGLHGAAASLLRPARLRGLPRWDPVAGASLVDRVLGHLRRLRAAGDALSDEVAHLVAERGAVLAGLPPSGAGLLHGDVHARNVLVSGGDRDVRVHVIDWESCATGPPALDLACLHDSAPDTTTGRAVLDGYASGRSRWPGGAAVAPEDLVLGRTWLWLRRMTTHEAWILADTRLRRVRDALRDLGPP